MAGSGGGPIEDDLALQTLQSYGTPAFYLPDQNPILRTPSGLRRGYQDFANTPVTASTQTAALALDLSEGAAIGAERVADGAIGLVGSATAAEYNTGTGVGAASRVDASNQSFVFFENIADAAGDFFYIDLEVTGSFGCNIRSGNQGGAVLQTLSGGARFRGFVQANGSLDFALTSSTSGQTTDFILREFHKIAGNHFYQATSADEPTLNLTSGLYGYLGDGTSKHFETGLVPASSMTMMAAVNFGAADDLAMGAFDAGGANRCYVSTASDGTLRAFLGAATSFNGGGDIRSVPGIFAFVYDASAATLFWKPISGPITIIEGPKSYSGSPTSTNPIYLLGGNNNGSLSTPMNGTIWRALAQQSAYTDAEIAAIANQWSRELAGLA